MNADRSVPGFVRWLFFLSPHFIAAPLFPAVKVRLCFIPDLTRDHMAHDPANEITEAEVNPAITAGDAGLIGGITERGPGKRHRPNWRDSRLDY
jgi:hypothetical protein